MSSASSAVTYTSVYTDSEPGRVFWGADEELSDGGSPRVIVYGYDGLPMLSVAPPSPDYPHDPDFVPEPIYPEYIPLEDEHVLSAEEQPLPPIISPIAESPEYVAESDLKEDPEEYKADETEDGLVNYPMDVGDDGDDDDGDSSGDDADKDKDEEEQEHLALVDSVVVIPTDELAALSFPLEAKVERLLAMPTLSPSPLASLSPPSAGERLARCTAPATLPSPPLPPPLHMPRPVDCRDDIPETKMPPCKKLCLSTLGSRYKVGESSTARPTRGRVIDYRHQAQMVETLRVMGDMRREMGDMHAELLALHEQPRRARQPRGDTRVPNHHDAPRDADNAALTWWNSQIRSLGPDAYLMTWKVLKKKMTDKYCALGEIKKLEIELRNLKYVSGLPDNIYGSVKASKPKMLDETIEFANDLMDQKLRTYAERKTNNKRKADDSFRNNHGHQQQAPKGSSGNTNVANAQRNNGANPKGNGCFECGATRHFKRDCPKLKNKDEGKVNAPGWVYAVGNAEKRGNASRDSDSNVVTGTFLLNNRYVSILFDTGADRSFISTAFSFLIDIVPTPLGNSYDVELANGKIVRVDTIMRGWTLNFLSHPFNIDLMPVELGSFDVIIGMDWLRRCHAVIVCDEKLVRIPYGNETLTFCGNESNNSRESRLTVISCSKSQEYMEKECQIFLAQISAKKEEDKSEGKQLEDVPVV
nr:hypothetical protein [Tanacetum cinerariifolium]